MSLSSSFVNNQSIIAAEGNSRCTFCYSYKTRKYLREGITKCSNDLYNKFTNIRQHNKYLLEQQATCFDLFTGHHQASNRIRNKVLLRNWDPKLFTFLYLFTTVKNIAIPIS